jgi:N-acetylmuramoyl-L-alanine amidase
MRGGQLFVATSDGGLARLLQQTGATLSYDPSQRYIVVTSADHRTITFTLGRPQVKIGAAQSAVAVPPFLDRGVAYLPLFTLAEALYLEAVRADGAETVLQPQIGAMVVRTQGSSTLVTLHAAIPLTFRRLSGAGNEGVSLAFDNVSSQLDATRVIGSGPLHEVDLYVAGNPHRPTTTVNFDPHAGAVHALALENDSPNEVTLEFASRGMPLHGEPVPAQLASRSAGVPPPLAAQVTIPSPNLAMPEPSTPENIPSTRVTTVPIAVATPIPSGLPVDGLPEPTDLASSPSASGDIPTPAALAEVSAVNVVPDDGGLHVDVALDGPVDFRWHRLLDNRWYVDLIGAHLTISPRDQDVNSPDVSAVRVHQLSTDPHPIVRITLALNAPREVDVRAAKSGLSIVVGAETDAMSLRFGDGRVEDGRIVATTADTTEFAVPGAPSTDYATARKSSSHLIVIDPGHGGSDPGAQHNGLTEKDLTLDISRRIRALLEDRGWTVMMTRDSDIDVVTPQALAAARADGRPNPDDRAELQSRDDIANARGARFFLDIHINSFGMSNLRGTAVYYYKPIDHAFADALHRRLVAQLGIPDLGVRRDKLYVLNHSTMPAALVEVAFLSNPQDADLLRSPDFRQRVAVAIADGVGDFAAAPAGVLNTL